MKAFFVLLATFVFTIANVFAASDYLLEIEGIKGEILYSGPLKPTGTATVPEQGQITKVKIKNPQGIEVMSWSFGASNPTSVNSFSWGATQTGTIKSSREAGSGLATGKRMHKPFVITKELDKSSPIARIDDNAMSSSNLAISINVVGTTLTFSCNQAMVATYDLKAAKK